MSQPKTFTARRPVDLIALAPYLLGFHPEDSVVLLSFGSGTFHARVDLPREPDDQGEVAAMLARVVAHHRVERVALLLYTSDADVACSFHDRVVPALRAAPTDVIDVLRVGPDRFHPADDPDHPGQPYDLTTHPFTAEHVLDGRAAFSSRQELAASLDPAEPEVRRRVEDAAHAVDEELFARTRFVRRPQLCRDLADEARWVQRIVRRHVGLRTPLSDEDAGRLLLLTSIVEVRDVAWAEMRRTDAGRHVDLWRDLVRRCPADLIPSAASLLAFAAWLAGDGALAWCALDRCFAVDPDYSMAHCVAESLERAVPPTVWEQLREEDLPVFWTDLPAGLPRPGRTAS